MARSTAQQKTPQAPAEPDPLADLREDDDQPPAPPEETPAGDDQPEAVEMRPMVTQGLHDEMVAEMVAAWHHDPTSLGFLHGGGSVCGCAYIARHALKAAVPVVTLDDLEEKELEGGEDNA